MNKLKIMKVIVKFLPLIFIILIALNSVRIYYLSDLDYDGKHFICFILITIALFFILSKNLDNAKIFTLAILTFSTFDLLRYSLTTRKIIFGSSIEDFGLSLTIQPRSLIFLIIFIVLNRDFVAQIFNNLSELIVKYKNQDYKK